MAAQWLWSCGRCVLNNKDNVVHSVPFAYTVAAHSVDRQDVTLVVDPQVASHGAYQGTSLCLLSYICLTISDLRVCNRFNLSDLYSFYIELNSSDPWFLVRLSGGKSSYIYCSKGREYTQEEAYNIHGRKYMMKLKMKNIYKKH